MNAFCARLTTSNRTDDPWIWALIIQHLLTVIEKPQDLSARWNAAGITLAGIAFANTGTAAAHSIGYALATISGIPHGRAVAIRLGAILEWNVQASSDAFAAVAEALGSQRNADAAAPGLQVIC